MQFTFRVCLGQANVSRAELESMSAKPYLRLRTGYLAELLGLLPPNLAYIYIYTHCLGIWAVIQLVVMDGAEGQALPNSHRFLQLATNVCIACEHDPLLTLTDSHSHSSHTPCGQNTTLTSLRMLPSPYDRYGAPKPL